MNIKRGAISAEFGRAVGMVTNAITKSGSNVLSGSLRFVLEPSEFTWKSKDPTIVTKSDAFRPAIGMGGPVIKDKVWWYLSASIPRSKTIDRVNKWGSVPDSKYNTDEFFLKLNSNPHPQHMLTANLRNSGSTGKNAGIGVYDHPSTATDFNGTNQIFYFSWTWTITSTAYLEVKYDHVAEKNKDVPITDLGYQPEFNPAHLDKMGYFYTVAGYLVGAQEVGLRVGGASLFNTQTATRVDVVQYFDVEKWDPYTPKNLNPNFGQPISYAPPRIFALTFYLHF